MSLIMKRQSIRKFTQTQVTKKQITALLKSAMQAPSAHNQQPWEFIVIDNKELLVELVKSAPNAKSLLTASIAIVPLLKPTTLSPLFATQDLSAATQNILLEAVNQGLGTVWIGVYPNQERVAAVKQILNIKDPLNPFSIIAVGVPDEKRDLKIRYDETRVHYNKME